jgi:hypothetical protein
MHKQLDLRYLLPYLLCLIAAVWPILRGSPQPVAATAEAVFPGWPTHFAQRRLTQLPLSTLELRMQRDFPGRIGRFTDGQREIILRWVTQGTRRLHPSADCFKGNGYQIQPEAIAQIDGERWARYRATRGKEVLLVSERIVEADALAAQQWTDFSSWYWASQLGQSHGPWWAVTVAQHDLSLIHI